MKASARNQLTGTVSTVHHGPVNTEIVLDLAGGDRLVAVVTTDSAKRLGLEHGKQAVGLVKAPAVTLVTEESAFKFSARNQLGGQIEHVTKGAVNSEVAVRLPGGNVLHAVVTNEAVADLQLVAGRAVTALIKASSVIVGVPA